MSPAASSGHGNAALPPAQRHQQRQKKEQKWQHQLRGGEAVGHVRRTCFICLEGVKRSRVDHSKKRDLLPCCTQCYAVVHRNCWAAYRRRQQLAAFRSRLLGQGTPTPHLCSICKTGVAGVAGDHLLLPRTRNSEVSAVAPAQRSRSTQGDSSALQEQLLASLGRLLQDDDEESDEPPLCTGLCACINTGTLVVLLFIDLLIVCLTFVYPLEFLLISLFLCYNAMILQLVFLAVRQRREYMRTFLSTSAAADEAPDAANLASEENTGPPNSGEGGTIAAVEAFGRRTSREEALAAAGSATATAAEGEAAAAEDIRGILHAEERADLQRHRGGSRWRRSSGRTNSSSSHNSNASHSSSNGSHSSSSSSSHSSSHSSSSSSSTDRVRSERGGEQAAATSSSRMVALGSLANRFIGAAKHSYVSFLSNVWIWSGGNRYDTEPVFNENSPENLQQQHRGRLLAAEAFYHRAEAGVESPLSDVELQLLRATEVEDRPGGGQQSVPSQQQQYHPLEQVFVK